MESLLSEYFPILVFLVIAAGLAVVMILASVVLAKQSPNSEKLSPYECGFEPFEDAFLFPWAVSLRDIGMFGFWSMIVFLAVLTVGFAYEWRKGALEWE